MTNAPVECTSAQILALTVQVEGEHRITKDNNQKTCRIYVRFMTMTLLGLVKSIRLLTTTFWRFCDFDRIQVRQRVWQGQS